ncbi:MAG: serine hydrolase [Bryobacterales bacterium]|nr:serine hydrolase [Bryobacterales bacterium]
MHRRLFLFAAPAALAAQGASPALEAKVKELLARAPGQVWFYAKNLDNGASYGHRAGEQVRTASTIKLPIMAAVFAEVEAGRAKFTETLPLTKENKVYGSGVLKEFSDGLRIPLRDLVHLMIVVSDNTATNMVLDRITADTVNRYAAEWGLTQTFSMRKILGAAGQPLGASEAGKLEKNKRFGLGASTPRDMVKLLEKLERGEVVSAAASKEMIAILRRQQIQDGIARRLGEVKVASKSGALDALRSDVGIVYAPGGRIAMAITVDGMPKPDWSPDNAGDLFIAELAKVLVEGLGR